MEVIRTHSHGLGGDSGFVDYSGREVEVRINRVVPFSLMVHPFLELIKVLQRKIRRRSGFTVIALDRPHR